MEVSGLGSLRVDTAFGGDSFVILDAEDLGFKLLPEEAHHIFELGFRITKATNDQLGFQHPLQPDWKHISFFQIAGPLHQDGENLSGLNAVVIQPVKNDRSPSGIGLCAHMAVLHAKGQMQIGDKLISRLVINSRFEGEIVKPTKVGEIDAIMSTVSGQGWITGTHQYTLDPTDPWPEGYRISDTNPIKLYVKRRPLGRLVSYKAGPLRGPA